MEDTNFRLSVQLYDYFEDHRRVSRIFIGNDIKTIRDLEKHIAAVFNIDNNFYLLCHNHYLPSIEDIRVLTSNDTIRVVRVLSNTVPAPCFNQPRNYFVLPPSKNGILKQQNNIDFNVAFSHNVESDKEPSQNSNDYLLYHAELKPKIKKRMNDEIEIEVESIVESPHKTKKKRKVSEEEVILEDCVEHKSKKRQKDVVNSKQVKEKKKLRDVEIMDNICDLVEYEPKQSRIKNRKNDSNCCTPNGKIKSHKKKIKFENDRSISISPSDEDIVEVTSAHKTKKKRKVVADDVSLDNGKEHKSKKKEVVVDIHHESSKDRSLQHDETVEISSENEPKENTHKNYKNDSDKIIESKRQPKEIKNAKTKNHKKFSDTSTSSSDEEIVIKARGITNEVQIEIMNSFPLLSISPIMNAADKTVPDKSPCDKIKILNNKLIENTEKIETYLEHSRKSYSLGDVVDFESDILHKTSPDNNPHPLDGDHDYVTKRRRTRTRKRKNNLKPNESSDIKPIPFRPPKTKAAPLMHLKFEDELDELAMQNLFTETAVKSEIKEIKDAVVQEAISLSEDLLHSFIKTFDPNSYPVVADIPKIDSSIMFKILKISDNYTPELSDYIIAKIVNVSEDGALHLKIFAGHKELNQPKGKFSCSSEDNYILDEPLITETIFNWNQLIEPRIVNFT